MEIISYNEENLRKDLQSIVLNSILENPKVALMDPQPVLKKPENVAIEKFFNIGKTKDPLNIQPNQVKKTTRRIATTDPPVTMKLKAELTNSNSN